MTRGRKGGVQGILETPVHSGVALRTSSHWLGRDQKAGLESDPSWVSHCPCPVKWEFLVLLSFEASGSAQAQGPWAALLCPPQLLGAQCIWRSSLLPGLGVKLPLPAKSILTWEFVHLTAAGEFQQVFSGGLR